MKRLTEFIDQKTFEFENYEVIKEAYNSKKDIKLPHTFDIYNEGPKNKDYKISKSVIHELFFKIEKTEEIKVDDNYTVVKFLDKYNQFIRLPLPADKIDYKEWPTKSSTNNWTKLPEINEYTSAGAWYSDKWVEYNWRKYNEDWSKWFKMLKPYMKGKISVTIWTDGKEDKFGDKQLFITVNNDKFNKEREEKIKELSNVDNLKKWAEEADAKEKAEIEQRKKEEEEKKKREEEWSKWWNSLSDDERLSWSMGYGRGNGNWTGD